MTFDALLFVVFFTGSVILVMVPLALVVGIYQVAKEQVQEARRCHELHNQAKQWSKVEGNHD